MVVIVIALVRVTVVIAGILEVIVAKVTVTAAIMEGKVVIVVV